MTHDLRDMNGGRSPLRPHGATPRELKARLEQDARGLPYLVLRDAEGVQRFHTLGEDADRVVVGRAEASDVRLEWDAEVSRVHAVLERMADGWVLADDGLSRNGSYVNHERVRGRRRLTDSDGLRFGDTHLAFRDPAAHPADETLPAIADGRPPSLTGSQRRVLVALCRPFAQPTGFPVPASNREIADELTVSVETVKSQLRVLFSLFGVEHLPRHEKRVRLVENALQSGAVTSADLERP